MSVVTHRGKIITSLEYKDMDRVTHRETLFEIDSDERSEKSNINLIDIPAGVHRCCPKLPFWHERDATENSNCVNKRHFIKRG